MLIIALAIRLESRGSPLFWQRRIGREGHVFEVCKFRTMRVAENDCSGGNQACRNDGRFTKVGRFLRRTSLDELPQLINVLRGEMSLVGPRPHAVDHHSFYMSQIDDYGKRLRVKPGITGWAQVNGWRGETRELGAMIKRVDFDLEYIARRSLWFDLQIMFYTISWYRWHSRNAY